MTHPHRVVLVCITHSIGPAKVSPVAWFARHQPTARGLQGFYDTAGAFLTMSQFSRVSPGTSPTPAPPPSLPPPPSSPRNRNCLRLHLRLHAADIYLHTCGCYDAVFLVWNGLHGAVGLLSNGFLSIVDFDECIQLDLLLFNMTAFHLFDQWFGDPTTSALLTFLLDR